MRCIHSRCAPVRAHTLPAVPASPQCAALASPGLSRTTPPAPTLQVALFKPAPAPAELLAGAPGGGSGRGSSTQEEDEPFLSDLRHTMEALAPDRGTSEWLVVGLTLIPKISWVSWRWVLGGCRARGGRDDQRQAVWVPKAVA